MPPDHRSLVRIEVVSRMSLFPLDWRSSLPDSRDGTRPSGGSSDPQSATPCGIQGATELGCTGRPAGDYGSDVILPSSEVQQLGVDEAAATLRFGDEPNTSGKRPGSRRLWLHGQPAFELSFWCGTCPVTFERLHGAAGTLSVTDMDSTLRRGLDDVDPSVLNAFGELLPAGAYLPMLLRVTPRLVTPAGPGDYFADEQVATWGLSGFWGLPENPRTPYYRTFETPAAPGAHLYEFVVPMVPPTWNERDRVRQYAEVLERG
jgi:hypothetical protein